jgi:HK97 family phage major capsid protein
MTIQELKQKIADSAKEMRTMFDKAEEEKRSLTAEENARYDELDSSIDQYQTDIRSAEAEEARKTKLSALETGLSTVVNPLLTAAQLAGSRKVEDDNDGFTNIGEYFWALSALRTEARQDKRLMKLAEKRVQSMGTGSGGGFALPNQFDSTMKQVVPQASIVRPRATVIPAGNPPDAQLSFPALDQTSANNIYGGVIITHTGEAVTMTETSAKIREVTLESKEMSAYIVCTNKLLNNWDAATPFISGQLQKAMSGAEDYDFLRGDGINKALGVINCAASISYSRAGAGAISYADVYGMFARAKMGGNLVWVASQTVIPQLAAMVDAGNHAVWIGGGNLAQGASASMPGTLFGVPIVFAERLPGLGTKGDLNLLDLSYYLIKDGSGPFAASADQIFFLSNQTVFKIVWNVDGKPWLTEPIGLEGSTTNTVSPFVVLN